MSTRTDDFDDLVPAWMFAVQSDVARFIVGVGVAVAVSAPVMVLSSARQFRFSPLMVLGLIAVAAVAGWWPTAIAGVIVVAAYWWNGVPPGDSFRLTYSGAFAVISMTALAAGLTVLTRRVQRSVADVRDLDASRRRDHGLEQASRADAERTAAQTRAVLALAQAVADASTMTEVAAAALRHLSLPVQPTTASIAIVHESHLRVLAAKNATAASIEQLERVDVSRSSWLREVLHGTPAFIDDRAAFAAANPEARVLHLYPSGSWAVLPFRSERTIGLLSVHFLAPQAVTSYASYFALVAEVLATALERAQAREALQTHLRELEQAFGERDRIARTLSTTLLPPQLPDLPGFSVAAWLIPANNDEVAGDFYDLFSLPDGDWVALLGDVCGKGAEAAAVTSLARYAARVGALADPEPVHVAEVAHAALDTDPSELYCTMAIARYRQSTGELDVSLAGHPQPRLVSPGRVERLGRFGAALGIPGPHYRDTRVLQPGETLVLFSDGLIERDSAFAEDELDTMLAALPAGDATTIAEAVRTAIQCTPPTRADDLTLLVVQRSL